MSLPYVEQLEPSHLILRLEPYSVNGTKRLITTRKVFSAGTGLALHLSGGEPAGAHVENLVVGDAVAWADAQPGPRPQVLHWRAASGQEVDIVIEHGDRPVGVEVMATSRPTLRDARHLRAFREEYGDAVAGCVLLHHGRWTFRMTEGVVAAPWSPRMCQQSTRPSTPWSKRSTSRTSRPFAAVSSTSGTSRAARCASRIATNSAFTTS